MKEDLINSLLRQLEQELQQIHDREMFPAKKLSESFSKCKQYWTQVQQHIHQFSLKGRAEEIHFAKNVKPSFCCFWFFVLERHRIELNEPIGTNASVRDFLEEELKLIQRYFSQHAHDYHYFKSGATDLDELYFAHDADSFDKPITDLSVWEFGANPAYDVIFTRFMAYERLQQYLLDRLQPSPKQETEPVKKHVKPTLVNLSVDQLGLITRAADDARLLEGRSFNRICEELAPYLSTPAKTKISAGSLRSNAYLADDIDKSNVIKVLKKMIDFIQGY